MPACFNARLATLGLAVVTLLAACKSESVTNNSGTSFANPIGLKNVGDVISINVNVDDPCANAVMHPIRVVAVGTRSVIWADTLNPAGGFTTADYQRFAAKFDTLIYPLDIDNFGDPTDIDKNGGRISIVFTRAVNELTPPRSSVFVGGLAFSRDLFPRVGNANGRAETCAGSNEGEWFYALTPDPNATINSNRRTAGFVDSNTTAVLAHELQHIINSSRRLYVNNAPAFEDKWLDEGLAHIAEELLFYRESGLGPRQNLTVATLSASARASSAFNLEMSGNATRYRTWLASPLNNSPYAPNDSLPTRGAAWNFIRYSVDRVNAADNFTAGNGQVVTGSGDATLTPGTTSGDYVAVVLNSTLANSGSLTFSVRASGAVASVAPQPAVPAYLMAPLAGTADEPVPDAAFEARIRSRERAELTPKMAAARAWYAEELAREPSMAPSRSLSTSNFTDADGQLFFKLVNNAQIGIANFQTIVGNDMAGFFRDWAVSNAVDDVAALTTQYQQRSWNWHNIYPAILQSNSYPLQVSTLAANQSATGTLVPGGAAYYKLSVPANGTATVTLSASGTTSNNLQLVVVKTR